MKETMKCDKLVIIRVKLASVNLDIVRPTGAFLFIAGHFNWERSTMN